MNFETDLITISHVETYCYYDYPQLYLAKDEKDTLYLVNLVDEHELGEESYVDDFLVVPISEERLARFKAGEIDLHDAFRHAEGGEGFLIKMPWGNQTPSREETAKKVVLADIDQDLYVRPGVTLTNG